MRVFRIGVLLLASFAVSGFVLANTRASVIDLTSNTILSTFTVGENPQAVAWASNTVAYIVNDDGNSLVRLDMSVSPPTIGATFFFPAGFGPHALAVNPLGTRALVTGDTTSAYLLDLTTPISIADTFTVALDANGVAFYSAGTKGIIVNEGVLKFLDLSTVPGGVTNVALPSGKNGLDVAVNPLGTRAVVSIDDGGIQLVDLTTSPPTLLGGAVGPGLANADPVGVAVSPDGTRAIYVDERLPASEANVMNITGLAPSLVNSVALSLFSPSAVAFNPVTAAALVHGDAGVAILNPPYTAVNATILFPTGLAGATAHSIAVNPLGTRAIVLHEDLLYCVAPELNFGDVLVGTTTAPVTVTCTNTGEITLTLNAISLVSGTAFALTGLPSLPRTVSPLGTFSYGVTFSPQAPGLQTGIARSEGSFGEGGFFNFDVALSGNGIVQEVTPTPTPTPSPTPTRTATPTLGPPAVVPTLSPGMLVLLGVVLAALGFFVARRNS